MKQKLYDSKIPTYIEVYNSLYSDIKNGVYQEGESLPGELALSEQYCVSRNTLRQALAILCEDGLILRSQGKGTVVAPPPKPCPTTEPASPLLLFAKNPIDNVEIQYNFGPPTDIARSKLDLGRGDLVIASNLIYHIDSTPIGYSFIQVPVTAFGELEVDAGNTDSIETLLTRKIYEHANNWDCTLRLIAVNEIEEAFLGVAQGHPALMMEAVLQYKNGKPLARCKYYFLAEHYHLQFNANMFQ